VLFLINSGVYPFRNTHNPIRQKALRNTNGFKFWVNICGLNNMHITVNPNTTQRPEPKIVFASCDVVLVPYVFFGNGFLLASVRMSFPSFLSPFWASSDNLNTFNTL